MRYLLVLLLSFAALAADKPTESGTVSVVMMATNPDALGLPLPDPMRKPGIMVFVRTTARETVALRVTVLYEPNGTPASRTQILQWPAENGGYSGTYFPVEPTQVKSVKVEELRPASALEFTLADLSH